MDEKDERRLQRVTWSTTSRSLLSCDDFNIVLSNITKAVLADHFGLLFTQLTLRDRSSSVFQLFFSKEEIMGEHSFRI